WIEEGWEVGVAVNLSVRNLQDPQLPDQIADLLQANDVEPILLEAEITESVLMTDPGRSMGVLMRLRKMGTSLSIDDFGTGYSSLGYLNKLPLNAIKIDKSFIMSMTSTSDDVTIVRSTIDLGHNLGLKVVAEGVENKEAWDCLASLGCDVVQGYYISRPVYAEELTNWMKNDAVSKGWTPSRSKANLSQH
ncbi:MAG TPA: EAL domain-containing protein, partial [Nitrospiria bacterium]|nr:EAL domain-containing protein [Nitrospiria bacterium]